MRSLSHCPSTLISPSRVYNVESSRQVYCDHINLYCKLEKVYRFCQLYHKSNNKVSSVWSSRRPLFSFIPRPFQSRNTLHIHYSIYPGRKEAAHIAPNFCQAINQYQEAGSPHYSHFRCTVKCLSRMCAARSIKVFRIRSRDRKVWPIPSPTRALRKS